jgi:hypothetical protein
MPLPTMRRDESSCQNWENHAARLSDIANLPRPEKKQGRQYYQEVPESAVNAVRSSSKSLNLIWINASDNSKNFRFLS